MIPKNLEALNHSFAVQAPNFDSQSVNFTKKEYVFSEAKAIADQFDADRYLNMPRPYQITLGQKMYGYAMPERYTMLKEAPYVIIPLFKSKELNGEYVSKLNPFATIWS